MDSCQQSRSSSEPMDTPRAGCKSTNVATWPCGSRKHIFQPLNATRTPDGSWIAEPSQSKLGTHGHNKGKLQTIGNSQRETETFNQSQNKPWIIAYGREEPWIVSDCRTKLARARYAYCNPRFMTHIRDGSRNSHFGHNDDVAMENRADELFGYCEDPGYSPVSLPAGSTYTSGSAYLPMTCEELDLRIWDDQRMDPP